MKPDRFLAPIGCLALGVTIYSQAAAPRLVQLSKQPPAAMLQAVPLGAKAPSDVLHLSLSLQYGDEAGIKLFADSVSNPTSPSYRQFISPEQVGARFGLPLARVRKVRSYLESHGMHIQLVAKNRLSILADATVAQAEEAFNTSIERFAVLDKGNTSNSTRFSFTTPPSLPTDIAADVVNIEGLESFTQPLKQVSYAPKSFRTLYGGEPIYSAGMRGQGRTIGISNWDGFRVSNEITHCSDFGLPTPAAGAGTNIMVIPINGGTGQTGTEEDEGDMDIQNVIGMAPLSTVVVYDNFQAEESSWDLIAVLTHEANDNICDIITESYLWEQDSATQKAAHSIHLAMSAQGITYMSCSGDEGTYANNKGPLHPYNYPVTDPEVLSVGGTSVEIDDNGNRLSEVAWNNGILPSTGLLQAGGGGWIVNTEPFNVRPPYQLTAGFLKQSGVPNAAAVHYRLRPDVSFDADPNTGYIVCIGGVESSGHGGTSGSTPTCAGLLADAEQQLIAFGALSPNADGIIRMGRIQDLLYSFNGDPNVFFDVTSGTNGTLPNNQPSNAGPGWDTVTGWGPIIFSGLVAKVADAVSSVTFAPSSVYGGFTCKGTIKLRSPASAFGQIVTLSSSNSAVAYVPATIFVRGGASSATFPIATQQVVSSETSVISASLNGTTQSATLTINPIQVSAVSVSPAKLVGGKTCTCTVTISTAAAPSGTTVAMTSSSDDAPVPATFNIPSGRKSASFTIDTGDVTSSETLTLTASIGSNSQSTNLTLVPPAVPDRVSNITVSPGTVFGGFSCEATVNLTSAAPPGGYVVSLSSSDITAASPPASITIVGGASSITFSIATALVDANKAVTLSASLNGASKSTTLTVNAFQVGHLYLNPPTVLGGDSTTGIVTILESPPPGGTLVSLASNSPEATVPNSVVIPPGTKTAQFTISTNAVTSTETVTITASIGSNFQTAKLTVMPSTK